MHDARLTIIDIAREAGVSAATVSRVLGGQTNVKPATASRVREIVDKYAYLPNSIARGLNQRQSRVLGMIMPDIKHPYYAGLFAAAQRVAEEAGCVMQLYRLAGDVPMTRDLINRLIERRLDGTLLAGWFIESPEARDLPAVLARLRRYMPIVTIGPPIPGFECSCVWPDLAAGAGRVVEHLAGLGHKRIAFIGATDVTRSVSEREQGFRQACQRHNVEPVVQYDLKHNPTTGEAGVLRLLGEIDKDKWPTALVVVNDLMALGVMKGLRRLGLSVPSEMAVVGCDNLFFSDYINPTLTTLDLSAERLGELAMRQLLSGEDSGATTVIQPRLVVRESCGGLASAAREVVPA